MFDVLGRTSKSGEVCEVLNQELYERTESRTELNQELS